MRKQVFELKAERDAALVQREGPSGMSES